MEAWEMELDLLSQTGTGADQFPEGRQVISGAPMREFPLAHVRAILVFILVSCVESLRPRRAGRGLQWTAKVRNMGKKYFPY